MRLRSTDDWRVAWSPAPPPRLTSRPPSASAREAAVAAWPQTGSRTTSKGPASVSSSGQGVDVVAERYDEVGAGRASPVDRGRPRDSDDRGGTQHPGRADARLPHRSAASEHEHPLTGLEPGPPRQGHPGSDTREAEGGRELVGHGRVERYDVGVRHQAQLGEAAVGGPHPGGREEPHPRTDGVRVGRLDDADALAAGHVGRGRHPEVRRPRGAQQVERHHGCRGHPDQRRPGGRRRRRMLAVRRRPSRRCGGRRACTPPHVAMSG